ncbi:MAG: polymer-forming cytoskeletal protein [Firmicutes bacterium]|nr:polymer-forming cytoskeletal protein [Bacillota bacterium]
MFKKGESIPVSPDKLDKMGTLIASGVYIEGTLKAKGMLRVDGTVCGEIICDGSMIIGKEGKVEAKVQAANLTIGGELKGDVKVADRLEILPSGRLEGNAVTNVIVIEDGGVFSGSCEMPIPEGKVVARAKPKEQGK